MSSPLCSFFFFFNDTATTEIYTLSLHDALPISAKAVSSGASGWRIRTTTSCGLTADTAATVTPAGTSPSTAGAPTYSQGSGCLHLFTAKRDRKSTRLNSSHRHKSHAGFFLQQQKK